MVESHLGDVVKKAGKLDVSFNLIVTSVAIGIKLTELSDQRFTQAAFEKVRSHFITMTAADHGEARGPFSDSQRPTLDCQGRTVEVSRSGERLSKHCTDS